MKALREKYRSRYGSSWHKNPRIKDQYLSERGRLMGSYDPKHIIACRYHHGSSAKRKKLLRAAEWLYKDDPHFFVGGCADVSVVLAMAAEKVGMRGVKVMSGRARSKPGRPKVLHAWLSVDGERLDPTWSVYFGKEGQDYKGKRDTYHCFGVDPEDLDYYIDSVADLL